MQNTSLGMGGTATKTPAAPGYFGGSVTTRNPYERTGRSSDFPIPARSRPSHAVTRAMAEECERLLPMDRVKFHTTPAHRATAAWTVPEYIFIAHTDVSRRRVVKIAPDSLFVGSLKWTAASR